MAYQRLESDLMNQYRPAEYQPQGVQMNIGLAFPIIFIILTFLLSFIFLVLMPMTLNINTALWQGGEQIFNQGLLETAQIGNVSIRESLEGSFAGAVTSFTAGQSIIGFFTAYGWFIIIVVGIIVVILLARRQVETTGLI